MFRNLTFSVCRYIFIKKKLTMKKIVCLLILASMIAGCKKYEDGPSISFASKKSRIEGKWEIEKVFINGTEDTSHLNSKPEIKFTKDGSFTYSSVNPYTSAVNVYDGNWEFKDQKKQLLLSLNNGYNGETTYQLWTITLLKKDKIHLEMIDYDYIEWWLKAE